MSTDEGSVFTEDSDEEFEDESQDTSTTPTTEPEDAKTDKTAEESKDKPAESSLKSQEEKTEVTEKGTKLDPNPLSALNQQLANERAKNKEYEKLLNDPVLIRNYVAQFDKPDVKKEEKTEEPEMRVEDIQTTEDLHKYQRQQDRKVEAKLKELDSTISSVKTTQRDSVVASRIQSDIATVREQYPELNPKSDSYNKELDTAVGELYEMYDLDPETKSFKGQVSIKDIADKIMRAAGSSKQKGSEEAQTIIRDKRSGRAVSGASNSAPDESGMTPGQIIASRMKAAYGRR